MSLVVLDTSILVSSLLANRGKEARVVRLITEQMVATLVSPAILEEYETVLRRRKFNFTDKDVERTLLPFFRYSRMLRPAADLHESPDESDNRFLECAESGGADYLITGNTKHFPAVHGVTRVVKAGEFLDLFERLGSGTHPSR